jgi:hypothetical protein
MAVKRTPIDRRILAPQDGTDIVMFRDPSGAKMRSYDLKELGLPADIAALLSATFAAHYAIKEADSPRGCWGCLRTLGRFVAQDGAVFSTTDLTTAMIGRYMLPPQNLMLSSANKPPHLSVTTVSIRSPASLRARKRERFALASAAAFAALVW